MQEYVNKHILEVLQEFTTDPYYLASYSLPKGWKLIGCSSFQEAITVKKDSGGILIMSSHKEEVNDENI
jgi:hypothetical protein